MKTASIPLLLLVLAASPALAGKLAHTIRLDPGAVELHPGAEAERLDLPGYRPQGQPGQPALPARLIRLALPPQADGSQLSWKVELRTETTGLGIDPQRLTRGRSLRWLCGPDRCPGAKPIGGMVPVDERHGLSLVGVEGLAKLTVLTFMDRPVVNVLGDLRLRTDRVLVIEYADRAEGSKSIPTRIIDRQAARALLDNPDLLGRFLPPPADPQPVGLAIITTEAFVAQSRALSDYIQAREEQGYQVSLVTETDYDPLSGQAPDGRAQKIRAWLIQNQASKNLGYALMLGNPDPIFGDVPMMNTWPYGAEGTEWVEEIPTDAYYADLTGNWDLDGDGLFAEYDDDRGPGGVDFVGEIHVGRIPVYDSPSTADDLLRRAIEYSQDRSRTAWRRRVLFPASILFLQNQDQIGSPRMEGGDISEMMVAEAQQTGFETKTMYERSGWSPSIYESDLPLTEEGLIQEWNEGYGLVYWFGHGSEDGAYRTIWDADPDGNHIPNYSEMSSPAYARSIHFDRLPAKRPAFVFHGSCSNGTPENAANIGYTQLKTGAIASYASTRVALGSGGIEWEPDVNSGDVFTVGYFVINKLRMGRTAGQAISETRALLGDGWWGAYAWHTKLATSLYGDPTLSLENCAHDLDCDDGLSCNGAERCEANVCVEGAKVDCGEQDGDCQRGVCSEPDGSCQAEALDGLACDDGLFCTVADTCRTGLCQGTQRTCDPLADQCMQGICDEIERACVAVRDDEGQACVFGQEQGVCLAGLCVQEPRDKDSCSTAGGSGGAYWVLLALILLLRRRYQFSPSNSK